MKCWNCDAVAIEDDALGEKSMTMSLERAITPLNFVCHVPIAKTPTSLPPHCALQVYKL